MWTWLAQNKEWLFSGAGLTVLAVGWWVFSKLWSSRHKPPLRAANATPNITVSPVINLSQEMRSPDPLKHEPPATLPAPLALARDHPDLWLGFSVNAWGHENSTLCLLYKATQNYEEPIFEVSVKIPEDGSLLTSHPIQRLDADGVLVSCSIALGQVRDAVDTAILNGFTKQIPVRVTYLDRHGISRNFDELEIAIPFRESSIRRKRKD